MYLLPVIVSTLLPLITLPLYTRLLSPEDFGRYALATVYATVVTGLAQLGLAQGFDREFFARGGRDATGLLYAVLAFIGAALVVVGALSWALRGMIADAVLQSRGHDTLLLVTLAALSVQALRQYVLTFFRNRGEAAAFAAFSLAEAVLWAALGVLFVVALRTGVVGIPLGQALGTALVIGVMLARVGARGRPSFDGAGLRGALAVGLPLTPRVFISVASAQFDKYLIGLIGSVAGVGIYAVAQRLAYGVFTYMTALENVYVPRTMAMMFNDGDAGGRNVGRYLTPFAYASVIVAVIVAIFAEEMLRVLVAPEYWAAEPVMVVLALFYASMFFAKQKQLIFTKKTHLLSVLAVAGLILNVLINIPLIRRWGATGAAVGTCLAGVLSVWLTVIVSQRYYRIHYQVSRLVAIFGGLIVAATVILLVRHAGLDYPVRIVVKLALFGGFVLLGRQLGILDAEKMSVVIRSLYRRPAAR